MKKLAVIARIVICAIAMIFPTAEGQSQLTTTFAGGKGGGAGPPPTCNGTLDLSSGCAQPMLFGGLF